MGLIEPHACYLNLPESNVLLYKVITLDNFIRSILGGYLYFNRVDSYRDFKNADLHDGSQLPLDRIINEKGYFEKDPSFTAANYYDRARSRTYACCFSLENSDFIWKNYGKGGKKGKICIVFDFEKLRTALNQTLKTDTVYFQYKNEKCNQFFDINYGLIEYIKRDKSQINSELSPNPIQYTYIKDKSYKNEKELRISLSALGIGQFILRSGEVIDFLPNLLMTFDFITAIKNKTIIKILAKKHEELNCAEFIKNFSILS